VLDGLRALRNFRDPAKPVRISKIAYLAGFSQGGHAALWADRLRTNYAPELNIDGIASFAPATDLTKIFTDTMGGASTTIWLPPYLFAAYSDYYGLVMPANQMLQDAYASTVMTDARTLCIDQVETKTGRYGPTTNLPNVYQPSFIDNVKSGRFATAYPELANLIEENLAGEPTKTPILVMTGQKDTVILPNSQTALIQRLCQPGHGDVKLFSHPEATHYNILSLATDPMLDWLRGLSLGQKSGSQC
jgi:hypothetical protein